MDGPRIIYGMKEFDTLPIFPRMQLFEEAYNDAVRDPENSVLAKKVESLRKLYPEESRETITVAILVADMKRDVENPETYLAANADGKLYFLTQLPEFKHGTLTEQALTAEGEKRKEEQKQASIGRVCSILQGHDIIDMKAKLSEVGLGELQIIGAEENTLGEYCRVVTPNDEIGVSRKVISKL